MFNKRSLCRIRKKPELVRAHTRAIMISNEILDKRKGTVFVGRGVMTERQLEYMIKCAEETRKRKTW